MSENTILCDNTLYDVSKAYRDGAIAMRSGITYHANPNRDGSLAHDDWNAGHIHEAARAHIRFNVDIIAAPGQGFLFEEDPTVPRDTQGEVDST